MMMIALARELIGVALALGVDELRAWRARRRRARDLATPSPVASVGVGDLATVDGLPGTVARVLGPRRAVLRLDSGALVTARQIGRRWEREPP